MHIPSARPELTSRRSTSCGPTTSTVQMGPFVGENFLGRNRSVLW